MSDAVVTLTFPTPAIAVVELADRTHRNMFSRRLVEELLDTFRRIAATPAAKVAVVHGYDTYWCSGGTRDELMGIFERRVSFTDLPLYRLFLDAEIPVIAAMQGHALGGGLAMGLFADVVILAEESLYGANFMNYGFTPGMGATLVLPHKFGTALATEMLLSGASYHGGELAKRGVPFAVVKRRDVIPAAMRKAGELADKPLEALKQLKRHLAAPLAAALPRAVAEELRMHEITFHDPDVGRRIDAQFGG